MTAAEQLKRETVMQERIALAKQMLQASESPVKIRQYTRLSQKEINQLKNKKQSD